MENATDVRGPLPAPISPLPCLLLSFHPFPLAPENVEERFTLVQRGYFDFEKNAGGSFDLNDVAYKALVPVLDVRNIAER